MNELLKVGLKGSREIIVTTDKTATAFGSGTVDVFATPAMIALMEQTALETVASFLPDGHVTVGTEVHVNHLRATKLGKTVKCDAVLLSIEDRKLTFEVKAFDDTGIIGSGTHTRYIVDKQRFMSKL
jgi:fluoroacetyl-CoA thioesterase